MGLLRYFLALVVVVAHGKIYDYTQIPLAGDAGTAVQGFFVISGFYMALLAEKYDFQSVVGIKNFYLSRFFRIYPLYILCCLATLALSTINITSLSHPVHEVFYLLQNTRDKTLYIFSNLFIFGQDIMRFLVLNPSEHKFYIQPLTNQVQSTLLGSGFQVMGQSWTLALELTFYLLVPFIITRRLAFLLPLCVASFMLRYLLFAMHIKSYNMTVAFFPTALGIFLLGSIAYKTMYHNIKQLPQTVKIISAYSLIVLLLTFAIFYYPQHSGHHHLKHWSFILLIALALPFIFAGFKDSRLDAAIGELSYPLYMVQFFAFAIVGKYLNTDIPIIYIVIIATVISIIVAQLVLKPLDTLRYRLFLRQSQPPSAALNLDATELKGIAINPKTALS